MHFLIETVYAEPPSQRKSDLVEPANVSGIIVKFDPSKSPGTAALFTPQARTASLSNAITPPQARAIPLAYARSLASGAELYRFDGAKTLSEASRLAAAAAQMPGVAYATPSRRVYTQAVPVDAQYNQQWGYRYNAAEEGANFEAAWDITRGSPSQTIGIIDSGVAQLHYDLVGQLRVSTNFPNGGYDFVSDPLRAADGDGRDNDPSQVAGACEHGSHVMGTVAARSMFSGTGPAEDVAGGAPDSKVLMARALNFSGEEADVVDAMLWLGGLPVPGVALNNNPVRVINMSLGGSGACGEAYVDAIAQLRAVGTVVVTAAGNSAVDVANFAPAGCEGVIAVAATTEIGALAGFSNRGKGITLSAPGTNILSTGGIGPAGSTTCVKSGTSMAAPHVTAAVALAQVANPSLTVSQTMLALRAGARPFPASSNCTTALCGAGILDARGTLDRVAPTASATVGWTANGGTTVRENDGSASLSLARVGGTNATSTVSVQFLADTAVAGVDYPTQAPVQLTWGPGDTSDKTLTVPIIYRPGEQGVREFSAVVSAVTPGLNLVAPAIGAIRITEVDCNITIPITIGSTASGAISDPAEAYCRGGLRGPAYNTVRYKFSAAAGTRVNVLLESTTTAPAVLDTYVYLLDNQFKILAENDDIQTGQIRNSRIEAFALTYTGDYYIDVTTWSPTTDAAGTYDVTLSSCPVFSGGAFCNPDVDGDGAFNATDATLILRRFAGFSDAALMSNVSLSACATRRTASAVQAAIDPQRSVQPGLTAPGLDIDGDGETNAATDALVLLRVALGITSNDTVNAAVNPAAPRTSWPDVRSYLQLKCGMIWL